LLCCCPAAGCWYAYRRRNGSSTPDGCPNLSQRHRGVRELDRVHAMPVQDQRLDRVDALIPTVDVHSRAYDARGEPEREERALAQIAAYHHLVGARRMPEVFHSEVVLIGEEVR